ncbi:MAG: hypothetical protein MZV64_35645 [Ignavibacteriales bacterium]|nr:hypothetical protein [Ignavibacteriales bacterium]
MQFLPCRGDIPWRRIARLVAHGLRRVLFSSSGQVRHNRACGAKGLANDHPFLFSNKSPLRTCGRMSSRYHVRAAPLLRL